MFGKCLWFPPSDLLQTLGYPSNQGVYKVNSTKISTRNDWWSLFNDELSPQLVPLTHCDQAKWDFLVESEMIGQSVREGFNFSFPLLISIPLGCSSLPGDRKPALDSTRSKIRRQRVKFVWRSFTFDTFVVFMVPFRLARVFVAPTWQWGARLCYFLSLSLLLCCFCFVAIEVMYGGAALLRCFPKCYYKWGGERTNNDQLSTWLYSNSEVTVTAE